MYDKYIHPLIGNRTIPCGLGCSLINILQYMPLALQIPICLLSSSVKYILPVIQSTAIPVTHFKPYLQKKKNT